ncbi:hypothetical protein OC846_006680, partial [Tilletia horrida]
MQLPLFTLIALVCAFSTVHASVTSGTFTGTYHNITKCTYRYGPTSVPASRITTYHATNSTTGFTQKTKTVAASTKYITPTPQPTVTSTSTYYTSTVLDSTITLTKTFTTTATTDKPTTTYTVTTGAAFTPLGVKYPTTSGTTRASSSSAPSAGSSSKVGRRAVSSTTSARKTAFATAKYCTTQLDFVPYKTKTTTTGTTTITLSTSTVVQTTMQTDTYYSHFATKTVTQTVISQPTYYPGCQPNNIVSKVQVADGSLQSVNYYYDQEHFPQTFQDVTDAYTCCTICQRDPTCLGSAYIEDSSEYGEYNGYFGYSGPVCQTFSTFRDCSANADPRYGVVYGSTSKDAKAGAVVVSNGPCYPGFSPERIRFPECPYGNIICQRPGNGY